MSRLMKTRTLAAIAVTVSVGLAYFLWGAVPSKREQTEVPRAARPVKTIVVPAAGSAGERVFPGKVLATQKVNLAFRVSGQLVELPVVKGERVEPGALLARLDPRDFEVQLANAKSELGNARARLGAMKAGARKEEIAMFTAKANSARAQMNDALTTLDRVEKLYKAGGFSRSELDRTRTAWEMARSAYQSASQELAAARTGARPEDVSAMEFTVQGIEGKVRTAENALADTRLLAPFGGVIIDRYVDNSQSIQRDQPVVSLQDLDVLEVSISVPEALILHTKKESISGIQARFSSMPETLFPLTYKEASAQADPQTNLSCHLHPDHSRRADRPAGDDCGRAYAVLSAGNWWSSSTVRKGQGTSSAEWRTDSLHVTRVPVESEPPPGRSALVKRRRS
ncbi:hypothetical protein MASR2M79_15190 [Aminivibrio sp.]